MPDLSVIICTHNPRADCLRRTLESLAAQTLPKEQWELLIVDNASQPPLAERCDIAWHPHGRHVREDRLGLTLARLCGISKSTGQLLVYADDDNVLAPDYLENAIAIAARHPHLAVFGAGILEPEFEIQPPAELNSLLFLLALRSVPAPRWSNHPQDGSCLPFGAGLCVHRKTAGQCAALVEKLKVGTVLGRKGGELLFQHEDDLFSWVAAGAGQGFGIFPELRITHLISAGRLNRAYFLRLIYYSTFSHWILHYLLAGDQPEKNSFFRAFRTGLHALRNGLFSARCQWARTKGEDRAAHFILENQLSPAAMAATKSEK
jgi:glycosyltransferase involved in cell wall biosynthesis